MSVPWSHQAMKPKAAQASALFNEACGLDFPRFLSQCWRYLWQLLTKLNKMWLAKGTAMSPLNLQSSFVPKIPISWSFACQRTCNERDFGSQRLWLHLSITSFIRFAMGKFLSSLLIRLNRFIKALSRTSCVHSLVSICSPELNQTNTAPNCSQLSQCSLCHLWEVVTLFSLF